MCASWPILLQSVKFGPIRGTSYTVPLIKDVEVAGGSVMLTLLIASTILFSNLKAKMYSPTI